MENRIEKVAVYVRVSTTMQDECGSLDIQIEKMNDYCKSKGYKIYKIYSDVMSGNSSKRKGFNELEKSLCLKLFDAIVVWSSDRLSRNLLQRMLFFNETRKYGIDFISATEPSLCTNTSEGRFILNIMGAFSENEREVISKRTRSGMRKRAEHNKYLGGTPPFGYKIVDSKFVPDGINSEVMKSVFRSIVQLRSAKETAFNHGLNYATLLTRIRHPIYAGGMRYANRVKDLHTGIRKLNPTPQITWGAIEGIISKEEWEQVQSILDNNKKKFTAKIGKLDYLYSGLLKCFCGGKLNGNRVSKNSLHYRCEKCKKSVNTMKVDTFIYNEIFKNEKLKILDSTEFDSLEFLEDIDLINNEIKTLENKKNEFIELFSENFLTKEKFKKKSIDIDKLLTIKRKELSILNERIFKIKNGSNQFANLKSLEYILKNVNEDNFQEIKEILNLIISEVKILEYNPLLIEIKI